MPRKKSTRIRKGNQKKEEIAQVLEQCGSNGIVNAIDIRSTKSQKQRCVRKRFFKRTA